MAWQVHVYGDAQDGLKQWCDDRGILLHVYRWEDAMGEAGLKKDALYLIRPDTYVALAESAQDTAHVESFLRQAHLDPASSDAENLANNAADPG